MNETSTFIDNLEIPNETLIHYSKSKGSFKIIIGIALIATFIFYIIYLRSPSENLRSPADNEYSIHFLLVAIIGAYFIFKGYKQIRISEPQIILNDKGIITAETKFKKWSEVSNENVVRGYSRVGNSYRLVYDYFGGSERLNIDSYAITKQELENLLRIYRGRSAVTNIIFAN